MTTKGTHVNRDSSLRNAYKPFLNFKTALYCSGLVMKLFNNSRKVFKTEIITVKLKASLLLTVLLYICPLTFLTEVLRLSGSPSVVSIAFP